MHHVPSLRIIRTYRIHAFAEHFSRISLKTNLLEVQYLVQQGKGCISKGKQMRNSSSEVERGNLPHRISVRLKFMMDVKAQQNVLQAMVPTAE